MAFAFGAGAEFPGSGLGLLVGVSGRWGSTSSSALGRLREHRVVYARGEDSLPATCSERAFGWKVGDWREAWPEPSCWVGGVRAGVGVWVGVVGRGGWVSSAGFGGTVAAAVNWIFGLIIL